MVRLWRRCRPSSRSSAAAVTTAVSARPPAQRNLKKAEAGRVRKPACHLSVVAALEEWKREGLAARAAKAARAAPLRSSLWMCVPRTTRVSSCRRATRIVGAATAQGSSGSERLASGRARPSKLVEPLRTEGSRAATSGQLGNGADVSSYSPSQVHQISNGVEVRGGFTHMCVRLTTGELRCWGGNAYGELGNGTTTASNVPVNVVGVTGAVSVGAGSYHNCVALNDGSARCWGFGYYGQLGDGTNDSSNTIRQVGGLIQATMVAAGDYHTCALRQGGVSCWGSNSAGKLGNGNRTNSNVPVDALLP